LHRATDRSPVDPFAKAAGADAPPESGTPPPGFAQIVDMREWTFINPEISLYFFGSLWATGS